MKFDRNENYLKLQNSFNFLLEINDEMSERLLN